MNVELSQDKNENKNKVISLSSIGVQYYRKTGFLKRTKFDALRNVTFNIYKGESLGILGRNGAGKSTLLKVLSGIILPDKGKITNFGYSVALLSLQLGFDNNLSGRDNILLNGLILGFSFKEIKQRLDQIVTFSELSEFINYPVYTYSVGMRARLGFSIAFHLEPDVLLIDEVLGVGDAAFQRKSRAEIERKINSDKTVVLVSHNSIEIRRLCNRAVWIENGETRMEDEVNKVVDAYERYLRK